MKRAALLTLLLCLLTLPSFQLLAQEPGQVIHGFDPGGTRMTIASIYIPAIPNAPFTATVRTQVVRRLEDGTTVIHKNHRRVARDSSGRVFEERRLLTADDDTKQSPVSQFDFYYPASHQHYICDPQGRVCRLHPYYLPPVAASAAISVPNRQVTQTSLGNSIVSGVETVGSKELTVIPAEAAGANRPITLSKEFWYSPELGLNIVVKRFDPRSGTQNFLVDDLVLGDPDPSVFELPPGATILQEAVQPPEER